MTKSTKTYLVHYVANDGEMCSFKFETDRSFRIYRDFRSSTNTGLGQPFLNDMFDAVAKISAKSESKMVRHGGFNYYGMKRIKCMDTGETKYFCCC